MPVKCRKCGGDHFTSKCGKEKKPEVSKKNDSNHTDSNHTDSNHTDSNRNDSNRNDSNRNNYNRNDSNRNDSNRNDDSKKNFDMKNKKRSRFRKQFDSNIKTFKVKIDNLPRDLTLQNLNKMMLGWGRIGDIRLRQNRSSSYALINFFDMEARNYFIDAINGTPVGYMILNVTK